MAQAWNSGRSIAKRQLQTSILSHRLVEVQETEPRQIARELHDEIGQSLTVARCTCRPRSKPTGRKSSMHRLQESIQAVDRVLEQVPIFL